MHHFLYYQVYHRQMQSDLLMHSETEKKNKIMKDLEQQHDSKICREELLNTTYRYDSIWSFSKFTSLRVLGKKSTHNKHSLVAHTEKQNLIFSRLP